MCGIIAIVRDRGDRNPPSSREILDLIEAVPRALASLREEHVLAAGPIVELAERAAAADHLLRGVPGLRAMLGDRALVATIDAHCATAISAVAMIERRLDGGSIGSEDLEAINEALVSLKDALWAIQRDRLRTAAAVADLAGPDPGLAALETYLSIQQALSALDRLEVRGRDSAGLQVLVSDHQLDLDAPSIQAELARRQDPLLTSMAVATPEGHLSFVYKAAAEIGELGDNTKALREAIRSDGLLRQALVADTARSVVLGHTRWASVGIISQANAHPLDSEELGDETSDSRPYVTAVLNGDVDNFADLKANEGLRIASEITTDAKVIPTLTARQIMTGVDPIEAFRLTVNRLEGSVAIAANVASRPGELMLALRGSGQALYVGLAENLFIVASEPYGVVEETATYFRMDGETPADPDDPTGSRGQVVRLCRNGAGTLSGVQRWAYNGGPLPVGADELTTAQITTRDIDRGEYPHFLLKEISEAPASFRKTLRGKLVERNGRLAVHLGEDALPTSIRADLRSGRIDHLVVIGQGTAAIAGQSLAVAINEAVGSTGRLRADALLASELSGFALASDMSNTLVVAISQSGTTTDTNRTVDLVRARGARVIAIVNRRNSDLTDKSDGVLYTSDGRDVEMSVASTKAFYSQIAAGFLLASAIAELVGPAPGYDLQGVLRALRELPAAMERTLDCRPALAEAAQRFAPSRRHWAIVGNGSNRIAANEIRIKLSELCYKAIACDSTEDKKHIDLSSEPLILVCAAGLAGSTADDVAKEVAIFRAHKAAPIVIASEGEERFSTALQVVYVPSTHPAVAFVLSTMAGHLFGYEAALAIDAQARPLREARAAVERLLSSHDELTTAQRDGMGTDDDLLARLADAVAPYASRFFDGLRSGELDGHLEASTAARLSSVLRYALGVSPLDTYQLDHGKVGTPSVVIEDLMAALSKAIEELTRPVDAIKHQAKTVTVGISRSDETLLQAPLVKETLAAGAARDRLSYQSLRTIAALDCLVEEVLGYTRYAIEGRVGSGADEEATIAVVDRGGIGRELRSRTEDNPVLRGTKHRVATERLPLLAKGRADGRTVLIVPEVKDNQTTGLTLLHVRLAERLPLPTLRTVLQGYRGRYQALKDAVTETEPTFRDDLLVEIPIVELMTEPINDLAEHWRS
ncbi:MAG: SIS domain-containing protein [Acidimicrobiales bacterium]|nr:SIS domain-containing protein [Acidimicrobiales bacterium]